MEGEGIAQEQPPKQKCPRCDSMNTKFCYYNNYSLSQPRHYCKTCKRYWTHGGTFRNIPVGGGSRKGKRAITKLLPSSSSPSNSLISQPIVPNLMMKNSPSFTNSMVHSTSPYYHHQLGGGGSGYLSSLPTFRSLINTSQLPLNHSTTTLPFSGFNPASSLPPRFHSLYPAAQQGLIIPSSSASHHSVQRPQSLFNNAATNANHRASSDASLWSSATINANSISGNISNSDQNNVKDGSSFTSLIPNHWLHFPGYAPPK